MESLLAAIRKACSASTWSRGVELARSDAVMLQERGKSELEFRVATKGGMVAPIGVIDDFFDLGGESLHAFALISRVQRDLGVTLSPRDLFACASVAAMAALIGERRQKRRESPA